MTFLFDSFSDRKGIWIRMQSRIHQREKVQKVGTNFLAPDFDASQN